MHMKMIDFMLAVEYVPGENCPAFREGIFKWGFFTRRSSCCQKLGQI
jgi:hypothetical protein